MIIIYFKDSYLIPYENCRFLFGQLSETIEKKIEEIYNGRLEKEFLITNSTTSTTTTTKGYSK